MEMLERKHLALLEKAERHGEPTAANIGLCFELLALASAIDRDCAVRLAPYGLSEGKFVLLFLLHSSADGLSPHKLAEQAGVTRATITGLLDGLERDGLLTRLHIVEDRRRLTVRLTDKGAMLALNLMSEHTRWIGSIFDGFTPRERDLMSALLRRVWQNIASDAQNGTVSEDGVAV